MKKKKIVIIIFLSLLFFLYGKDDLPELTENYLIENHWGTVRYLKSMPGIYIAFQKDGKCEVQESEGVGGGSSLKGSYKIKNNKVYIYDSNGGVLYNNGIFKVDDNPLRWKYCLEFEIVGNQKEKLKIWNQYVDAEKGTETKIKGVPSYTMDSKSSVTTENLNIREYPSLKSVKLKYTHVEENDEGYPDFIELSYIPKGTELIVLARTKEKVKVGKWYNYWYYIEYQDGWSSSEAWAFAEFIE